MEAEATPFPTPDITPPTTKIYFVPSRHFSMRGLNDRDNNLWGGYVLQTKDGPVYFAGDTGYDSVSFKQLGKLYNIDLALIPIGPCADCDHCGTPNHVFPPDAVMLFKDTKAKWMLPIHYGTLYFAQAEPDAPLIALNKIIVADSLQNQIIPLKIGEQKIYY